MRNRLDTVEGPHSGACQAWVYVLVLPLASRVASGDTANLNVTKADNDRRAHRTAALSVSC